MNVKRRIILLVAVLLGSVFLFLTLHFFPENFTYAQVSSSTPEELLADVPTSTESVSDSSTVSTTVDSSSSVDAPETSSTTEESPEPDPPLAPQQKNSEILPSNPQNYNNFGGSLAINEIVITTSSGGEAISSLDLNENNTKTVYVRGSYYHPNGCSAVVNGQLLVKVHREFVGTSCYSNETNCYSDNGSACNDSTVPSDPCEIGNPEDVTAAFECEMPIQYFAEPTDVGDNASDRWAGTISITDVYSSSVQSSSFFEVNTLAAVDIPSTVQYGYLDRGQTSYVSSVQVFNTGNKNNLSVQISGTPMTCTGGYIPVENQRYSTSYPYSFESMIPLTSSSVSVPLGISRAYSHYYPSSATLYWRLLAPESGAGGVCSGSLTVVGE